MAKAKRRRRQQQRRRAVNRNERVAATPETLAKLRPDYLQHLLARDPADGIDHQEVEALLAIETAWHVIERQFGQHRGWSLERGDGGGTHEMSDAAARLWSIWCAWATEMQRRTGVPGSVVASVIELRVPLAGVEVSLYRTAARIWMRAARDTQPARPLQAMEMRREPDF